MSVTTFLGTRSVTPTAKRSRLLKLAHSNKHDFLFVHKGFSFERLLRRLTLSPHADRFTLKGVMLFTVWAGHPHCATRGLHGGDANPAVLARLFDQLPHLRVAHGARATCLSSPWKAGTGSQRHASKDGAM